MISAKVVPVALTIAGSDSGGGAGIQADLKTFAAFGAHGASAIACLTAQNPRRVIAVEPCSPQMLQRQLHAVFEELQPRAAKTGMLFSAKNIAIVAEFFRRSPARSRTPLIVDPVLVSTSGSRLLEPKALKTLTEQLLPAATLVTPNLSEAEILSGLKISSLESMRAAARQIQSRWGCAVLVKGGHLKPSDRATDCFFDGTQEFSLSSPFVKGIRTHGTGCVYSAAIAAGLALGMDLPSAVRAGKKFVTQAISRSYRLGPRGRHFALQLP